MESQHDGFGLKGLLHRQPWVTFLLPFLVFVLVGSLEPTPDRPGGSDFGLAIPYAWYPWLYAIKIVLTVAAIAVVWPGYRQFPWRLSLWGLVVGLVGGTIWIGLCRLDWEHQHLLPLLQRFGLGGLVGAGDRAAFNPFVQWAGQSGWAWTFLAVRALGLVVVVPVIEEFFLRGFLMRVVVQREWQEVPFGRVNRWAVVLGTAVPMLMHPGELLAAAVWFSLVTWLMVRTRNLWDCVAAHAVTNLLLGVYVVVSGDWRLL
ncbi:MAG: CAAX prenyl protease-related protein [Thermoguttaceae bacterium]